jgi:hypothetical protein
MKLLLLLILLSTGLFSKAQTSGELLTFPIELKTFKAQKQNQKVLLHWLAPCQVSEATFDIQHSTDSKNFTTITSISADQARCEEPFEFTDPTVRTGQQFYRIRMTAVTNQTQNSFTISVFSNSNGFELTSLRPNTVTSSANLQIATSASEQLQLYITNWMGVRMAARTIQVESGSNQVSLDLQFLPAGSYYISAISNKQEIKTIRFIKQ